MKVFVMTKDKRRQLYILSLLAIILAVLAVLLFSCFFAPDNQTRLSLEKLSKYDEPWVLKNFDGQEDKLVDLPCKLKAKPGETITLMSRVPKDVSEDSVLVFETRFQNVVVLLNDERIYSYGVMNNQGRLRNAVPCINVVSLAEAKPGDVLTIHIVSGYKKYSGSIRQIYYGNKGAVASSMFRKHGISLFFSLALFFVTLLVILAVAFIKKVSFDKMRALYAFGFAICAELWMISQNPMLQFVFKNHFGMYMAQCILLLLLPVFFMLYQSCFNMRRRFVKIFEWCVYIFSINLLTGIVFQALAVVDFASYMTFTKVLIFLALFGLLGILYMAKETFDDQALYTNLLAGMLLFIAWILEFVLSLFKFYSVCDGLVFMLGLYAYIVLLSISIVRQVIFEVNQEKNAALNNIGLEKKRLLAKINVGLVYWAQNDVISSLKEKEYDESKLVYDASMYLQKNMKAVTSTGMVPFLEELSYIRAYIGVVSKKYPKLEFVIEDKVVDFSVPYNTVEPLVENAVINGALSASGDGRIVIRSYERLDCFAIQIVDNGSGVGPDKRFTGKVSYKDIKKQLKTACGAAIEIKTKQDKGTIVTVKIPKEGYIVKE